MDKFGWDGDSFTLFGVLMVIMAAERLYIPGKVLDFLIANAYPLIILFILGGVHFTEGRLFTEYLNPNIRGIFYLGGFSASLYYMLKYKKIKLNYVLVFLTTTSFLILSGSRRNIILLLIALIINFTSLKGKIQSLKNPLLKFFIIFNFIVVGIYIFNISYTTIKNRFNNSNLIDQVKGSDDSGKERYSFIETSLDIVKEYPTGIGYGNIKEGIRDYGNNLYAVTQNAHAFIAEIVASTGYFGLLFLIPFLLFIIKISRKDFEKWFFIPLYLIVSLLTITILNDKLFWVTLVFFEKDLMFHKQNTIPVVEKASKI
ncbi:O-antigen ligase family protein [Salinimicrobium gaetbulicola]|uniref:O-antigen ligase family protein n=1 Tax=Salinimicrobium gaetbulicola TaxID=999702 RepID=A0ABW3IED0_9FLAO